MIGPLVVEAGSDITAVEQRIVVQSVALGGAIHPYPGSTIPYHVVIHDKVLAVVVEVDAWAMASVVVNPVVGNARAFPEKLPNPANDYGVRHRHPHRDQVKHLAARVAHFQCFNLLIFT